ncbi:MAG: phosphoribosylanthranilate isomerase [Gelidibacter sp.]
MKKELKHTDATIPSPFERVRVRLKVCGMKYQENISVVAQLQPDYLGFIFYGKSSRFFDGIIPKLPESIKKVGVFVNATINEVVEKVATYNLQAVQLHGDESPEFCNELFCQFERPEKFGREPLKNSSLNGSLSDVKIIKVFSINDDFNFDELKPYETICDYYLFDTKGKLPGGNGYTFNWETLKKYPSIKPYFLSGGIGLEEIVNIKKFLKTEASKYCYSIDVNSKFEIEPGLKDVQKLKEFKNNVTSSDF